MFLGTYFHTIDERNRLLIPKKFREELVGTGILTRGLDKCLFLYNKTSWQKIEEMVTSSPFTRADARAFARHVFSGAMEIYPDRLGRIIIPTYLKEFGSLESEVALLGIGERVEIWSKQTWETYSKEIEKTSADIAERLSQTKDPES